MSSAPLIEAAADEMSIVPPAMPFPSGGRRYQNCADELQIHVSTLRYRLDRLKELFQIDWEEPEARFGLELALRLRSYIKSS